MSSISANDRALEVNANGRILLAVAADADEASKWKCAIQNQQLESAWDRAQGLTRLASDTVGSRQSSPSLALSDKSASSGSIIPPTRSRTVSMDL